MVFTICQIYVGSPLHLCIHPHNYMKYVQLFTDVDKKQSQRELVPAQVHKS